MARSRLIEIEVTLLHATDKAFKVRADVGDPAWVAKALCEFAHKSGLPEAHWRFPCEGVLTLDEHLAEDRGLI